MFLENHSFRFVYDTVFSNKSTYTCIYICKLRGSKKQNFLKVWHPRCVRSVIQSCSVCVCVCVCVYIYIYIYIYIHSREHNNITISKGKAVPLQAWTGPEVSRKLRLPDFVTTAQDGGKVVSLTHLPPLPPGNSPGTHFCSRLSRPQGHSAVGRILCQ